VENQGHILTLPVGTRDHATGGSDAALTLVEYGDYECPQCGMAYPIVKNIRRHFGDKLKFVFRNFPLTDKHPHAELAAQVAEAAAAQGKFWEMHDMLFEHQNALEHRHLLGYASKLGLDVDRMTMELERRLYLPRIQEDRDSGTQSGVNGTPQFYVNGNRFDGEWAGHDFADALTKLAKHT
jgi:protein-disulfide isomerase